MSVYLNTSEVDHFLFNSSCSLIHFNARSMRKHYDDIQNLLSTITKPFPIICITETWLSDADKNLFGFPNYSSEYAHRPSSNHGGAAIYVLSNLAFKRRHDLALNLPNCEAFSGCGVHIPKKVTPLWPYMISMLTIQKEIAGKVDEKKCRVIKNVKVCWN